MAEPCDPRVVSFYTDHEVENDRLAAPRNRLEFLRTRQLLRDRIAPSSTVLDVGGAAGAHAAWLAADGHCVEIIDPVPLHIDQARAASLAATSRFTARLGDARWLDVPDESVDACLLLGPLYHLLGRPDRVLALREAVRVCRPGGLVFAAAISRTAWPLYELRNGAALSDEAEARVRRAMAEGLQDPGETTFYSHRPCELRLELEEARAGDIEVLGIEGPGWILFVPGLATETASDLLEAAVKAAALRPHSRVREHECAPARRRSQTHVTAMTAHATKPARSADPSQTQRSQTRPAVARSRRGGRSPSSTITRPPL